jgi:hypothetical protein
VDHAHLADQVVASVLDWSPEASAGCTVESAERVEMAGDGPGVSVQWSQTTKEQGTRRFGLIMSIRAFDYPGVTTDDVVRNLLHMLRGPHATKAIGRTRTWYVQSGPSEG